MERAEFVQHTARSLADAIVWAGERLGVCLPREYCVTWLGAKNPEIICSDMVESIVSRVYEGPDRIKPCVDLIVSELLDADRLLIRVSISGHEATIFGRGWTGRIGPYVFGYGEILRRQVLG